MKEDDKMKKNPKFITKILFTIYLILLFWIIIMKTEFSFDHIYRMRSTNFIPFAGTAVYNNQLHYEEIILNVLIFVPFGIYLSMLKPDWPFLKKVFPIFIMSLTFESLQYILAIGATDITDLLGNTLGGMIGILTHLLIYKIMQNKTKTTRFINLLASIGTVSFILFFGFLLIVNF